MITGLWLTRAYVNTALYEQGRERMPFQGRLLMMLPLRLAQHNHLLQGLGAAFSRYQFWFPQRVAPEVLVQGVIFVVSLLAAGWFTTQIYNASSTRRLLSPLIYPLFLVVCSETYVMHTVQNFRFIYDLPSLAFFAAGMYLIYFRWYWAWFAALFCIATINRETTLLLLPIYLLDEAVVRGEFSWKRVFQVRSLAVVVPLGLLWGAWELLLRHHFAANPSEFYPRIDWNVKSLLAPLAWPQLLSSGGYLLIFIVLARCRLMDPRLRAWLWILPVWLLFMFVYGILVETRIFGELIPIIVCATALISEEMLLAKTRTLVRRNPIPISEPAVEMEEVA